jgi:hypothetical protein
MPRAAFRPTYATLPLGAGTVKENGPFEVIPQAPGRAGRGKPRLRRGTACRAPTAKRRASPLTAGYATDTIEPFRAGRNHHEHG